MVTSKNAIKFTSRVYFVVEKADCGMTMGMVFLTLSLGLTVYRSFTEDNTSLSEKLSSVSRDGVANVDVLELKFVLLFEDSNLAGLATKLM